MEAQEKETEDELVKRFFRLDAGRFASCPSHRAAAACRAISERLSGDSFSIRLLTIAMAAAFFFAIVPTLAYFPPASILIARFSLDMLTSAWYYDAVPQAFQVAPRPLWEKHAPGPVHEARATAPGCSTQKERTA